MSISPSMTPASLPSPSSPSTMYPQFLLFGDSITQFCTSTLFPDLSNYYSRRLDILNRGFSGYTAPRGFDCLVQFFPAIPPSITNPQVRLMTVFFGANDACVPGNPQHVPLETYKDSLRHIATHKGVWLHETKVIFVTPPPVDEWQFDDGRRNAVNTARYAAGCRDVASEFGLPVLDLWTIFMRKAGWEPTWRGELPGSRNIPRNEVLGRLLVDGLHFTAAAYQIMFEELVRLIEKQLPGEMPESLPSVFPDWKIENHYSEPVWNSHLQKV